MTEAAKNTGVKYQGMEVWTHENGFASLADASAWLARMRERKFNAVRIRVTPDCFLDEIYNKLK